MVTPQNTLLATSGVLGASVGFGRLYHRTHRNRGSTEAEQLAPLPGDELVPNPASCSTMAISIAAPPAEVWPWLVQMGVDRAGFYTHLWLENGILHLGVTNADSIVPSWQHLAVGDCLNYVQPTEGRTPFGPIVTELVPDQALIAAHSDGESCFGTWQFILKPEGDQECRLLMRSLWAREMPPAQRIANILLEGGYTYMSIGMLQGIADRASGRSANQASAAAAARLNQPVASSYC